MKTNKKDFEFFKRECKKYINLYGLNFWNVIYRHHFLPNRYSEITIDLMSYKAIVVLSNDTQDSEFNKNICAESAKHEIIHLLLARLSNLGASRFITYNEITSAEEEMVQKLLKLLP